MQFMGVVKALMDLHKVAQVQSLDNLKVTNPHADSKCDFGAIYDAVNAQASLHICTGSPEPSPQYQNLMRWLNDDLCPIYTSREGSGDSAPEIQ